MPDKKDVGSATPGELDAAVANPIPITRPHEAARAALAAELDAKAPVVGALVGDALALMRARASGAARPLPLPWPEVAKALGGGLWPGLHVLTGATGTGKTQWALQVALAAAKAETPTLYLALELGEADLVARLLALEMGEEGGRAPIWSELYLGKKPDEVERAAGRAAAVLHGLPLRIEVAPPHGWPVDQLEARVAALRALYPEENGPGSRPLLVVIDYLQAVGAPLDPATGRPARMDLRERIGVAAYQGRAAARDHGAAVLMLSSVSRENAKYLRTEDGKPLEKTPGSAAGLVGLGKESGDIEYAADSVLALVREGEGNGWTDVALAVAKVRAGRAGWVDLRFNGGWFEAGSPVGRIEI